MGDRHRSYTTTDDSDDPAEPLSFDIDGETFECLPEVPGVMLLEHFRAMKNGNAIVYSDQVLTFFEKVMEEAEHERFRKYIEDPGRTVTTELLGRIYVDLLGDYDRVRPTKRPPRSQRGRSGTAPTSTAAPSATASDSET